MYLLTLALIVLHYLVSVFLYALSSKGNLHDIPQVVKDVYDEASYQQWTAYTKENKQLGMIKQTVSVIMTLVFFTTPFFPAMHQAIASISHNPGLQFVFFVGVYYLIDLLISIPFSYYKTFLIETRYGFNKTTKKLFLIDKVKGLLLATLLGGTLLYGLHALYLTTGTYFFISAFLSFAVISVVLNILYVPIFVKFFNKLSPLEEGTLSKRIEAYATEKGFVVHRIYVMNASKRTTKLNAFFTGFSRFKKVVLYDNLLNAMDEEAILAVLAHEIGHAKHKDIVKNLVIGWIESAFYLFLLVLILQTTTLYQAFRMPNGHLGFGLILFMVYISVVDIFLSIITSYLSRKKEYAADRFASSTYPDGLIRALKILARQNFSHLNPHPLVVALTYSHPPIAKRIEAIMHARTQ